MRSARLTSLVVLAGALAAGLAIQAADDSQPDSEPSVAPPVPGVAIPAARPDPTLSSTWYCAGGTATEDGFADHEIHIANPTDRARSAVVTVLSGEVAPAPAAPSTDDEAEGEEQETTTTEAETTTTTERPRPVEKTYEVPAQSRVDVRLGDLVESELAGAVVEVDGGEVVVEHNVLGDLGRASAPCSTTASPTWLFPWGVTTRGNRELMVFMNPFPDDATVDISFATDEGVRQTTRFQGFIVPGRSVVGAYIDQDVTRKEQVSADVRVRGGRLIVDRIQTFDGTDGREGITMSLGVAAPAETWIFPMGETGEGLLEQVVVFNPNEDVAEVEVEVLVDDPGDVGPPEPFELTVPPGRYSTVDVHLEERVAAGGHAFIVRSLNGVPVAAERVNSGADPAAHTGITSVPGSPIWADRWYFAAGGPTEQRDQFLVLLNMSNEDDVTYRITGLAGGQTIAIQDQQSGTVPAGGRTVIRLGDHIERDALPLVIQADGPIVAERGLYRIGGGGISQSIGVPLAADYLVPEPVSG